MGFDRGLNHPPSLKGTSGTKRCRDRRKEGGRGGPIDRSMEHICLDFSIVVRAIRRRAMNNVFAFISPSVPLVRRVV